MSHSVCYLLLLSIYERRNTTNNDNSTIMNILTLTIFVGVLEEITNVDKVVGVLEEITNVDNVVEVVEEIINVDNKVLVELMIL